MIAGGAREEELGKAGRGIFGTSLNMNGFLTMTGASCIFWGAGVGVDDVVVEGESSPKFSAIDLSSGVRGGEGEAVSLVDDVFEGVRTWSDEEGCDDIDCEWSWL